VRRQRSTRERGTMFFPAEPRELARKIVSEWASGAAPDGDPIARSASIFRSGSDYHERMCQGEASALYGYFAEFLCALVDEVGRLEVGYTRAKELSVWSRGTIKNKKKTLGDAGMGKVRLSDIPLQASKNPGIHAVRAIELVTERTEEADAQERVRSAEDDDDAKWAEDAVQAITG
jgi:hypothetical protein